jgi:hypothetical protein
VENQTVPPAVPVTENPCCLYPEELGRTFGDAMEGCTLDERAHYMACQRVILNFDLAVVRRHLDEVWRRLTRNYGLGLVQEAHADLKALQSLRNIESQHIAKSAHIDRLDWYLGTTETRASDYPGCAKDTDSELPRHLPLPLHLINTSTVNTARVERITGQSSYSNSDFGSTLPSPPLRMSPVHSQQPSMNELEYNTVQPRYHQAANSQPGSDQTESYGRSDSDTPTARPTYGDWESDSDYAPSHVKADGVRAIVSAHETGLLVNLGRLNMSVVPMNNKEYSTVDDINGTAPSPASAFAKGAIQQQPSCRLITTPEKTSSENPLEQLFGSSQEQQIILGMNKTLDGRVPLVFRHGVQYVPETSLLNRYLIQYSNYKCHAVMVSDVPEGAEIRDILPLVRGGKIVRSSLVSTVACGMGLTALVTFADWKNAHEYTNFSKKNPELMIVLGHQVIVELANTPTYPSHWIQLGQDNNLSRCVELQLPRGRCHQDLLDCIQTRFKNIQGVLEDAWIDESNMVVFLFRNIEDAIRVHDIIAFCYQCKNDHNTLRYGRDPCEEELDSLKRPASPNVARGDHPSIMDNWISENDTSHIEQTIMPLPSQAAPQGGAVARPPPNLTEYHEFHDEGFFKSEGASGEGLKFCSLEQYNDKYGYSEYIQSHDEWLKAWPYVGDLKRFKPQRNEKMRIPKTYQTSGDGPRQELIGRDSHAQTQEYAG